MISDPIRSKREQFMTVEAGCIFGGHFLSVPVSQSLEAESHGRQETETYFVTLRHNTNLRQSKRKRKERNNLERDWDRPMNTPASHPRSVQLVTELDPMKNQLFVYKAPPLIRREIGGTNVRLISGFHCTIFRPSIKRISR